MCFRFVFRLISQIPARISSVQSVSVLSWSSSYPGMRNPKGVVVVVVAAVLTTLGEYVSRLLMHGHDERYQGRGSNSI